MAIQNKDSWWCKHYYYLIFFYVFLITYNYYNRVIIVIIVWALIKSPQRYKKILEQTNYFADFWDFISFFSTFSPIYAFKISNSGYFDSFRSSIPIVVILKRQSSFWTILAILGRLRLTICDAINLFFVFLLLWVEWLGDM